MTLCRGCDITVHQHLDFHSRVSLNDLPEMQQKKQANLRAMKERQHKRMAEARPDRGYAASLTLIEPPDALELPPRTPPSPVALFALDDYVKQGQELERRAEVDFLALAGVCAICQTAKATLWCEECKIPMCESAHDAVLNRKSCDEELHGRELLWHQRIPFDPEVHKRQTRLKYTTDILILPSVDDEDGGNRRGHTGTGIWADATPPPSLPPSELPSPVSKKSKKLSLTERGYNYVTGDTTNLPACEICSSHTSVLYCHDCRFFLCIAGGCDSDLHASSGIGSAAKEHSHDRRYLKDGERVHLTPVDAPKAANPQSSFVAPQPKRAHSHKSHSHKSHSHKSPRSRSRTGLDSSRYHSHSYSKSLVCQICRRFQAKKMCLECEMNFCEGGTEQERAREPNGAKKPVDCSQTWHAQDPAFKAHKLKSMDTEYVDTERTKQPSAAPTPRSVRLDSARGDGSSRVGGSVSARILSARSTASTSRSVASESSEEDEIRRAKRELAELREQREQEEALLEAERAKLEAEEARLAEEERLEEEKKRLQEEEDELDDIQLLQREQAQRRRKQAEAAEEVARSQRVDLGLPSISNPPTARSVPYDSPDFDPLSLSPPPPCSVCEAERADVFCRECAAFFCAHPLNEWDLKTPRGGSAGEEQCPRSCSIPAAHGSPTQQL